MEILMSLQCCADIIKQILTLNHEIILQNVVLYSKIYIFCQIFFVSKNIVGCAIIKAPGDNIVTAGTDCSPADI